LGFLAAMLLVFAILLGMVRASAETQTRTFFNSKGQEVGRSVTHGKATTFSNERGQNTGRAERRPDGTTNFYDSAGRLVGRSRDRR
jgi:hypothetical protein